MTANIDNLELQFALSDHEAMVLGAEVRKAQEVLNEEFGDGFFEYVDVTFRFIKTGRLVMISHSGEYASDFIIGEE